MGDKTVLIVDDDEQIREVLGLYLAKEGFVVVNAADGLEAVTMAETHNPHIILLDIMLPFIDGFESFRRIRRFSSAPIIMMTARHQEADRRLVKELGGVELVSKPFSPREMANKVTTITRRDSRVNIG
jgi:DNA-binding response OmpR family regulator